MAVSYKAILWNQQKKIYDKVMLGLIGLYLVLFVLLNVIFFSEITAETLLIRATGSCAIIMLHVILIIGPLCRLDKRYLPLLYNRRHLGVTMFLIAFIHGAFSMIHFHALGDLNPFASLFLSNTEYLSLTNFPFQVLGFFALLILFLMAATSHDFWLKNLGPKVWKSLHMMVYVAYALLIMHVLLGVMQLEKSPVYVFLIGAGMISIIGLHLKAAFHEKKREFRLKSLAKEGFVKVCEVDEIVENRAKVALIGEENIAVFKYDRKVSAVSNVCKHQNGPLGEGKIVNSCIVCPWHAYQYLPGNGQSPPPFKEKVCTYDVKVVASTIYVNPNPHPEGTPVVPAKIF